MPHNWLATRIWLLVIILSASLTGAPAYAQGAAAVRVDPSTLSVQANAAANISIKIDNVSNLTAFEIHLSFNPVVLEVTSLTNGGFVAADFTAQNVFDNAAGTIDYAVAQMNRTPANGSGALLNIAFRAKANGSSTVTTRDTQAAPGGLILADLNGSAIQASWAPGTINVGSPPPITNTPTNTSAPVPVTNTPGNASTSTPITNTPTNTSTPAPITNTPTNTSSPTLCPPTVPQGMTVVRFDPATSSVKVDNVPKPPGLAAFEIHLSFDPNILEVTSVSNGGFIVADFEVPPTLDNTRGKIDYAASQKFRLPVGGSGTLLKIVFRAKANGSSTVTTYSTPAAPGGFILSDANGNTIPACWAPGTINGTQSGGTHVVRWGEWLYCIARAYRVSPWAIASENGIRWPNIIFPNQKLIIPNVPWTNIPAGRVCQAQFTASAPTPTPTTAIAITPNVTSIPPIATPTPTTPLSTAPPSTCRATYVVRAGDNLYRIALRYGTTYTEIARVNGISNPRLIYPGQQLCIP